MAATLVLKPGLQPGTVVIEMIVTHQRPEQEKPSSRFYRRERILIHKPSVMQLRSINDNTHGGSYAVRRYSYSFRLHRGVRRRWLLFASDQPLEVPFRGCGRTYRDRHHIL